MELSLTLASAFLEKQYVQTLAERNLTSLQRVLKHVLFFWKNRGKPTCQQVH